MASGKRRVREENPDEARVALAAFRGSPLARRLRGCFLGNDMHRFGRAGNPGTQLSEKVVDLGEIFVDGGNEFFHGRIMLKDDEVRKLFRTAQEPYSQSGVCFVKGITTKLLGGGLLSLRPTGAGGLLGDLTAAAVGQGFQTAFPADPPALAAHFGHDL
jgi:hypothetical protein